MYCIIWSSVVCMYMYWVQIFLRLKEFLVWTNFPKLAANSQVVTRYSLPYFPLLYRNTVSHLFLANVDFIHLPAYFLMLLYACTQNPFKILCIHWFCIHIWLCIYMYCHFYVLPVALIVPRPSQLFSVTCTCIEKLGAAAVDNRTCTYIEKLGGWMIEAICNTEKLGGRGPSGLHFLATCIYFIAFLYVLLTI